MTDQFSKTFKASIIVHAVVIIALIIFPVVMRWMGKHKKKEEIIFIEMVKPAPPAPISKPEPKIPEPEPKVEKEPEPKPEPPKPVLKKPKQIKVNTNRVVRNKPQPKPKPKPRVSEDDLRKQLLSSLPTSPDAPVTAPSAPAGDLSAYYGTVYRLLDAAWVKPPGVGGLETEVSIRIARNGGILQRKLVSKSGSQAMDDSVMSAVRSVATFPRLPDSVRQAYIDVTIKFESTGLSM